MRGNVQNSAMGKPMNISSDSANAPATRKSTDLKMTTTESISLDALLSKYWGSPEKFEKAIRDRLAERTPLFPNTERSDAPSIR